MVVSFIERRPILAATLVGLLTSPAVALAMAALQAIRPTSLIDSLNPAPILIRAVPTLIFVLVLRRHGWLSAAGFNGPAKWRDPWLAWLPALLVLVNLSNLIGNDVVANPDIARIVAGFGQGLSIALFEETTYRGLVLAILLNRYHATRGQVIGSVLFGSLLFGLYHLPTNPHWEMNVSQWIYATFLGVGFAAVMLRTRSIWIGVAIHALIIGVSIGTNALISGEAVLLGESGVIENVRWRAMASVLVTLPIFVYGLYLLRGIGRLDLVATPGRVATNAYPEP